MRERLSGVRSGRRARVRAGLTALVISAPLAVVAATQPSAVGATGPAVTRLAGIDRYATAAAIAQNGWPAALPAGSMLLLATGANFPDAVAGAAAAGRLHVPLLLTATSQLSGAASAEISRLKPATVALLGSASAVSDTVRAQVAALGPTVVRWQGLDRYGTAAAVSKATYPSGATNVYLATGKAFPDALAGGALAAKAGGPLLLSDPASLPDATKVEIARLHPSAIVVLGGTASVSAAVANSAVAAAGGAQLSRISGPDRYQTANAIASVMVAVNGGATASQGVVIATGLNFPDALAGAAFGGATDRPLLLVPQTYVTPETWQRIQTLAPPTAFVLGGSNTISAGVEAGIAAGSPPTAPPAPPAGSTDWLTYHKDAQRSGAATGTPAFLAFSSAWKAALDGAVYGEPIVVGSTVVAATEGGSVYGLSLASGAVLWRTHIANPIPRSSLPCGNIDPLGITSTPVYDPATGLALALGETAGGHHILAGVHLSTGAVAFSRTLDPLLGDTLATQQRAALLLTNGRVYVAYGGLAGDCGSYIGQVVSVASDGSGTPIGWAVPTSREGGIWAPPGPVALGDGTLLVAAGNGASTTTYDGSDSVSRLSANLARIDWFAPSVWASDNSQDLDLGSMAPVIVGGRIFTAGKRGTAYLLDPAHLGGIGGQLTQMGFCVSFGGGSVAGNVAYIPCTDGVRAVAVSGNSMSVLWKAAGGAPGSPVNAAGTVYASDGSSSVVALDAANGGERASIAVGSMSRFASPSLSGNTLLIGTMSGVTAVHVS